MNVNKLIEAAIKQQADTAKEIIDGLVVTINTLKEEKLELESQVAKLSETNASKELLVCRMDLLKSNVMIEQLESIIESKPDVNVALLEALKSARDHLDFVGYGDAYEKECSGNLENIIAEAIALAESPTVNLE